MSIDIARNPDKLKPGDRCAGICLQSFLPRADQAVIPGSRAVVPGRVMGDYADKPVDGDGPATYFMPDEPLEGTRLDSPFYLLENWAVFRSRTEAMAARAALASEAISAYRSDMGELSKYI